MTSEEQFAPLAVVPSTIELQHAVGPKKLFSIVTLPMVAPENGSIWMSDVGQL